MSETAPQDIGFIGLGIMGTPMAFNLLKQHRIFGFSRSGVPKSLLSAGAVECGTAMEVAQKASTIIIMVPGTEDVQAVLFGRNGIAPALNVGKMVVDMSSISPIATCDIGAEIEKTGALYCDAPVSGGEVGAKNAALTIMAGGSEEAFARAAPLFGLMGKNITHVGPIGAGQTAKVANQIIVASTIAAVGEALVFAAKAGADPARVRDALLGGFAASPILEVHGERMLSRKFAPGFRMKLHRKDLGLALESAGQINAVLPCTAACHEMMNAVIAAGDGDLDHSALVTVLERLSSYELDAAR